MMRSGFTLIELLVSLAISAILSISLTLFLSQTRLNQTALENRTSIYTRASIALHQLSKDISGSRIPIENTYAKQKEKQTQQAKTPTIGTKAMPIPPKTTPKEEPVKPIEHIFYAEQKDKKISLFTCITSNPLKVYWSKSVGKPKPAIARVVYRLMPDPKHTESFVLHRQEGADLALASYHKTTQSHAHSLEVIDGIHSLSMRFIVVQPDEKEKDGESANIKPSPPGAKKTTPSTPPKITEYTTWDWPVIGKKQKDAATDSRTPLPTLVSLTLRLWDMQYERTTEFVYTIPVYSFLILEPDENSDQKIIGNDMMKTSSPSSTPSENKLPQEASSTTLKPL